MSLSRRSLCALTLLLLTVARPAPTLAANEPPADLAAFSRELSDVAEQCRAATVGIIIPGGSMGSGVIVSADGLVLTAAHVLPEAGGDVVIVTADGKQLQAKALGVNRKVDSGLAQITEPGNYPTAPMADADTVWEGDWVIAFGHGGGVQTDRPAPMRLGKALHISSNTSDIQWITTDCTVISGDSGGPLFDLQGNVIGIHSNIGMSVLVNRHVPIRAYHAQWEQLHKPVEFNQPPAPDQPLIPGLDLLPDDIEREIARRLNAGDEALRQTLEANRNADGNIDMTPEAIAALIGQEGALETIQRYQDKLKEREKLTNQIENAGQEGQGDESDVSKLSAQTRQMILDKLRERALDNIAEQLRKTNGKIAEHVLAQFDPAVSSAGACTVEVICRGKVVALGTIVREDGYIVTKASELQGPARVRHNEQEYYARVVQGEGANDLALLKIDAEGLTAVNWANDVPALGSLLVVPGAQGKPLAMGIVGVDARPIPQRVNNLIVAEPDKPFLGVAKLESPEAGQGVRVGEVPQDSPAHQAGVLAGDLITAVNDSPIDNSEALIKAVGSQKVGDTIKLTVQRGEETLELSATLAKRPDDGRPQITPERDDRQSAAQVYSARGGKLSERRTSFPLALTHDAIIWAPDIGGPVLNLQGQAVGLNIARYGRTATYALPAEQARQLIEQMMRGK